jgi:hypothetical protein
VLDFFIFNILRIQLFGKLVRNMSYVLATTESMVRWYKFHFNKDLTAGNFELLDILDLNQVPVLGDKVTAKIAAQTLGLKTWRYVKI